MHTSFTDVRNIFDDFIRDLFKEKPQIRDFLLKHPRKDYCVTRLCEQISRAESYLLVFDVARYRNMILEIAKMFSTQALRSHENSQLTHAEKVRRIHEADRMKRAEEMLVDLEKEAMSAVEHKKLEEARKRREDRRQKKAEATRRAQQSR